MGALRLPKTDLSKQGHLRIVKDSQQEAQDVDSLVYAAWSFAYSALWNNTIFSDKEVAAAKTKIQYLFVSSRNTEKAFLDFAQRVILARHYVMATSSRYVPLPSVWLDGDNEQGFAGTKPWLQEIKEIRSSLPRHKASVYNLAEAVLDFSINPTEATYHFWKEFLLRAGAPGLFALFQTYIINLSFGN